MRMTTNRQTMKEAYTAPSIEVIKMENEGVIALSSTGSNEGYTSGTLNSASTGRSYNSASSSELEDFINDILTVGN